MLLSILVNNVMIVPVVPPIPPSGGGGGGGGLGNFTENYYDEEKDQRGREEKIRIEDSEVISIVQLCLKITTI